MKILLVEDTQVLQDMMEFQLTDLGHNVTVASNGEEAVSLIKTLDTCSENAQCDLILMDVEMPVMDGYEATRQIREYLKRKWIPIIFTTALSSDDNYRRGADAGGDDYLIKPVSPVILETKLQSMERLCDLYTRLEVANEALAKLSTEDPLTGLLNRRAFADKADQAIKMCIRENQPLAVIMGDVDHFKLYNDNYGHTQGDECLKVVSQAMQGSSSRDSDIIARFGGEEFVMLLPNTDKEGAEIVGQRILDNLFNANVPHDFSQASDRVSMSIGVATTRSVTQINVEDFIDFADGLLYRSKQNGRNQLTVDCYTPPKTILVVDDNPIELQVVDSLLNQSAKIVLAHSGQEALDVISHSNVDMIFLDVMMPGMNGFEVSKQLRSNKQTSHIPIVFMSSCDLGTLKQGAKENMGNGYLHKPYTQEDLLRKVSRFLD